MPTQVATGYCNWCKNQARITRKGTNHVLHLLLSLCTLGLWSIVWVFALIKIGGWRCARCGCKVSRSFWK